jgi:PAS domain-containing protein
LVTQAATDNAPTPGTIRLGADGRYLDADEVALAILGVTLEQLRHAPPGSFSATPLEPDARAAFVDEWQREGGDALAGAASLRRLDGRVLRVSFLVEPEADGTFLAMIQPTDDAAVETPEIYTISGVLREWRAADRRLQEVPADGAEWSQLQLRVANLRATYHRLARSRQSAERHNRER